MYVNVSRLKYVMLLFKEIIVIYKLLYLFWFCKWYISICFVFLNFSKFNLVLNNLLIFSWVKRFVEKIFGKFCDFLENDVVILLNWFFECLVYECFV